MSGLRAGFAVDGLDPQESRLRDGMTPRDPGYGQPDRAGRLVDGDGEHPVPLERGDYPGFYEGVVAWLRDGAPPPVAPADAVAGLEILDAARTGAAERRAMTIRP
jgi:predicted dehydrogenase